MFSTARATGRTKKDKIVLVEGKKRESVDPRGSHKKTEFVSGERQQEGLKRKKG